MSRLPLLVYLWAPIAIAAVTQETGILVLLWIVQAVVGALVVAGVDIQRHDD